MFGSDFYDQERLFARFQAYLLVECTNLKKVSIYLFACIFLYCIRAQKVVVGKLITHSFGLVHMLLNS